MENARIARAFVELADLLELSGESPFKCRAYREFATMAKASPEPVEAIAKRGQLTEMNGVGKAIAGKVEELLATGTFPMLERLRAEVPASLRDLMRVPGLGGKSITKLWHEAGITSLAELAYACEENRLAQLSGIGEKKQAKILAAVRHQLESEGSMPLGAALEAFARVKQTLAEAAMNDCAAGGEARRGVDIVRELVVIVRGADGDRVENALAGVRGAIGCAEPLREGLDVVTRFEGAGRVRIRCVPPAAWVHALLEETGSDAHVGWLAGLAGKKGGLAAVCAKQDREEGVYAALGVPFAPPELREGPTPEIVLPLATVHGIFHVHTDWSDGQASILDMAQEAARAGFKYLGISDHSQAAFYANGLDPARLREQAQAIDIVRKEAGITILHGVEVDILDDGALDLDPEILASLDFVIASVHSRLNLGPAEMTARIIRAVSHPLVTMLGHPTGRLLLGRKGYTFDVEAVARAAAANDTYLEINANAQRLDLSDVNVRRAAAVGGKFVINPDAHAPRGVHDTFLGVTVARRAGLAREQVLNAMEPEALVATLKARKAKALARA